MQRCEKCQRLISDQATVCPHCGARYDVAAMPDPQKDIKRKRMKIALFILSGVAVILIAAIVVLLILRSIPKARTFDFSCTEYTDKINALLGTDKLDKDKWNITEAEAVYTADSFYIRLDTDKDSQRATKITVGPADSEDAVKMAAASLMVVYTEYTQTIAIDEIGRYRDGDRYIILPPDPVPATETTTKPTLPTLPTPESATATEVITEEVTEPPVNVDWKKLYSDYINEHYAEHSQYEEPEYSLILLDDNEIPELFVHYKYKTGSRLIYTGHLNWINDNNELQTEEVTIDKYNEKKGTFWTKWVSHGFYHTSYQLTQEGLKKLHSVGSYTEFRVDEEATDEATYNAAVAEIEAQGDKEPVYQTKSEILQAIENY